MEYSVKMHWTHFLAWSLGVTACAIAVAIDKKWFTVLAALVSILMVYGINYLLYRNDT